MVCLSLGLCCLASNAAAQVPDEDEDSGDSETADAVALERGKLEYQSGRWTECARVLGEALDPKSDHRIRDTELVREGRLYRAACLIGSGQDTAADEELRAAVREGPTLDPPDQRIFPPELVRRYIQIRLSMLDELEKEDEKRKRAEAAAKAARDALAKKEAQRVKALEQYAQVQSYTTVSSRWLALVPFGVGQFQNRDNVLGYTLLATEGVLAATALTAMILEIRLHRQAQASQARGETLDVATLNADLQTVSTITDISAWSFVGVTLLGVLQAQLAFVPEHTDVRYKPLPATLAPGGSGEAQRSSGVARAMSEPSFRVAPNLQLSPRGGSFGFVGSF